MPAGPDRRTEPVLRIVTYNVEWFESLFDEAGRLRADAGPSGRQGVTRQDQITALGAVFRALDADAVMVIEAPDLRPGPDWTLALHGFARHFGLRARQAVAGFASDSQQEIAVLFDPDRLSLRHDPQGLPSGKRGSLDTPRFDSVFRLDLDIDGTPDLIRWSRPPLELAARTAAGHDLRLIGVHAKSKAPHGADTPAEVLALSIQNRRKQLAQCIWLRQRIDRHLAAGDDLIVLGDFNDGPGLDEYEKLFGRSSVEIVIGEDGHERLLEPHARLALSRKLGAMPTSARFRRGPSENYLAVLLDYVMVSQGLARRQPVWRIWHPFDDPACYADLPLREALLAASDHFPVSLEIDL